MNDKLKQIIFDKLYEDLKHVEIIPYYNDIWFIDRKEKHWYFEYEKSGDLWWRWDFFDDFFQLFSMEFKEYQWVISEWVEEVLNYKVETPISNGYRAPNIVEEVLNCKVTTLKKIDYEQKKTVEDVLNYKVKTLDHCVAYDIADIQEILNFNSETIENEQ